MEAMRQLARADIPERLDELGQKHQHVDEVIAWCESSYVSGNKKEVQAQTKEYIVDALESVTKEVEETSAKLTEFLKLQNEAIDGMTTQLEVIRERLSIAKAQNAETRLAQFRKPVPVPRRKDKIEVLSDKDRDLHMQALVTYDKTLDDRMTSFDDVGSCLQPGS